MDEYIDEMESMRRQLHNMNDIITNDETVEVILQRVAYAYRGVVPVFHHDPDTRCTPLDASCPTRVLELQCHVAASHSICRTDINQSKRFTTLTSSFQPTKVSVSFSMLEKPPGEGAHDQGKEFVNKKLKGFLTERGVQLLTTNAYTPEENTLWKS
ncbi:hypothetical protein PC129_g21068 [Phytophthora cactorum]|nr:hypothetical protein PC117_g23673 [Phytophthora cactorum]KAG3076490.1 hypothetical protein PC121_g7740 [Phytophthora cactorum]KAG3207898.1 hypothetical protein PC129_g21068 [Phytophthora cactorum]RAW26422.1 hypothetical protein PC110_g17174 [Phytophthora cactorum]